MTGGLLNRNMIDTKLKFMRRFLMTLMAFGLLSQASFAQIRTYTNNAEDSMMCIQNLSLYIEYFKQDNYNDAVIGWREAAKVCPKSTESLWANGIKIYEELADKTGDKARQASLLDTMFWAYDKRIEHFGKEGYVLGRKGSDLLKYKKDRPELAYEALAKSLELQGNEMEPGASIYLYKAAYDMFKDGKGEKSVLFDLYSLLSDVIDYNLQNQSNERMKAAYQSAKDNIDKMFSSVAECPDLLEIYTPKFEATPSDEKLLRQILKVMDKRDCTEENLYLQVAEKLYAIDPSPEASYAIANGYAKKKNYTTASEYYGKTIESATDNDLKMKALEKGARTAIALGQGSKAKSLAMKMLSINGNSGEAYIIIGDAYIAGKSDCGGNECSARAIYWAAVDKYMRAKSIDPSVSEEAQKKINIYSEQFPKKEDCFFHGINEGTTFTFDCWIGETTTVRTRSN